MVSSQTTNGSGPSGGTGAPGKSKTLLQPLDWGIAFARSHLWSLFALSLLPICLELVASYVLYSSRLLRQEAMVMFVLTSIANVWLLTAATMLVISVCQKAEYRLGQISLRALTHLPKVFFSYVLTLFIIMIGLRSFIVPGLVFVGFLIWSPAFCIGESFVSRRTDGDKKDKDDEPEGDEDEEDERARRRLFSSFLEKAVWDFGFVRSWRLAGTNFRISFQLALFFLAAVVVPSALVDLLGDASFGYAGQALKIILTSFAGVLVTGIWAGTFVMLLPVEAKKEIQIVSYRDPASLFGSRKPRLFRFDGNIVASVSLVVLTGISSWFVIQKTIERTDIPKEVTVEVLESERGEGQFRVSFRLIDPSREFRWIVPEQFRLSFPEDTLPIKKPEPVEPAPVESPPVGQSAPSRQFDARAVERLFSGGASNQKRFFRAKKIIAFDDSGKVLDANNLSPYRGALKLVVEFEAPPEVPEIGSFELYYASIYGPGDPLLSDRYGTDW